EASKKLNYEIWLSVSEAASLAGVGDKTIRRAVKESNLLVYKIVKDRYRIELKSLINYMNLNTKLNNKFLNFGLGQYVDRWKDF
ncbi:helix-turn-helix domain-containing protein, partial [Candidatus Falkowbacteria bacterium]|nr:helix-turn-helix domain-containing protein [Candidatus Falkowbacteria bacterium]